MDETSFAPQIMLVKGARVYSLSRRVTRKYTYE